MNIVMNNFSFFILLTCYYVTIPKMMLRIAKKKKKKEKKLRGKFLPLKVYWMVGDIEWCHVAPRGTT